MHFRKNTGTLDHLAPELLETVDPAEAGVAVIGSKPIDLGAMPKLKATHSLATGMCWWSGRVISAPMLPAS